MLPRRDFLAWLGAAAAAYGFRFPQTTGRLAIVGIQLYTLRRLMQEDVERTLAAVAEIGYREVEFAGYFGRSPRQIRELLDRHGLRAPAAHVGTPDPGDAWNRVLDAAEEVGHRYVVTPWVPEPQRTADGYRRLAEVFNRAGAAANARGITFAYHNHDFRSGGSSRRRSRRASGTISWSTTTRRIPSPRRGAVTPTCAVWTCERVGGMMASRRTALLTIVGSG